MAPTHSIGIHVFLGRSHTNMYNVFRLVNPVLDRNKHIFKVTVFIKRANMNRIPYSILCSAYSTWGL